MPTDVVLIAMPFGAVFQPAMSLSLLKAELQPLGVSTRVLYPTLDFAQRIGFKLYNTIAANEPTIQGLVGEWVFASALFDNDAGVEDYVHDVLHAKSPGLRAALGNLPAMEEKLITQLLALRAETRPFIEECLARVLLLKPRIVGFTSTFQQQVPSLALARRIKEVAPEVFVVFGGANCEGVMGAEVVRQFGFIDAVVSGEGDLVFPELVRRVLEGESYADLQGVNTRDTLGPPTAGRPQFTSAPMVREMDSLPYADYDDFFEQLAAFDFGEEAAGRRPRLMFETSRGCWWGERAHCTFCGLNGGTMAFRAKSERRALAELLALHERYPDYPISVTDNILDMRYFKNLVPELAARKIDLELFYEVKANLKKEQVRMLRDAGIRAIQPGIESFIDDVLNIMRKGVKSLQNVQLLKWCKEYGVTPHWNLIWGFPGERPEAYAGTADLLPRLTHLPPAGGGGLLRLDRFSPNFEDSEALGFVDIAPYPAYFHIYPFAPEVVANLAYFFTYHYREPRDVNDYVGPVKKRLLAWREEYPTSDLFSVAKGENLLIWDLRSIAREPLTTLRGALAHVYAACDSMCHLGRLCEILTRETGQALTEAEIEEALQPLVDRDLLMRDGAYYLALAVPLGEYSPSPKILERFQEVVQKLGDEAGSNIVIPLAFESRKEVLPLV
jgi:ribosomal peptide maturation radical SAM protein 1